WSFFFSSRRRHTRCYRDWSSDVCSSDLTFNSLAERGAVGLLRPGYGPTTNRHRALAELVRGTEVNARLGGVPKGKPVIDVSKTEIGRASCRGRGREGVGGGA